MSTPNDDRYRQLWAELVDQVSTSEEGILQPCTTYTRGPETSLYGFVEFEVNGTRRIRIELLPDRIEVVGIPGALDGRLAAALDLEEGFAVSELTGENALRGSGFPLSFRSAPGPEAAASVILAGLWERVTGGPL